MGRIGIEEKYNDGVSESSPIIGDESGLYEASPIGDSPSRLHREGRVPASEEIRTPFTPVVVDVEDSLRNNKIPSTAYETPTHRQPTPSKFVFLSDRKSVPTELKNLQERTIKRRRDFVARMHDLVRTCTNNDVLN